MKLFDIHGTLISVDVRPSSYPVKGISKSKLQGETAVFLQENFPRDNILEEFVIPGSKMSFDFFLPTKKLAIEVQGIQHDQYSQFFHGDILSKRFANQVGRDRAKAEWAENNKIRLIEIRSSKDLEQLLDE